MGVSEIKRWLAGRLPDSSTRRLVVLTGARQTGKTTLARSLYSGIRYLNLDAIEVRDELRTLRTSDWSRSVGVAVLDEAQKEPTIFDKVKYAYDAHEIDFSVLLGSSRIMLLDRVRETLAGRAFLFDLWPLLVSEIHGDAERRVPPLIDRLLEQSCGACLTSEPELLLGAEEKVGDGRWPT